MSASRGIVERYLELGLRLGRHVPGFVDAYYGPEALRARIDNAPVVAPGELVEEARALLSSIDASEPLGNPVDPDASEESADETTRRRAWIRAQVLGLLTSARILAGDRLEYADEVEACYGVRPTRVDEETFIAAHRDLERVVPGTGALSERLIAWRESHAVDPDKLSSAIHSLAEDLRERTDTAFGLPEGESVEFIFARNEPWSGFNYYLGALRSRVAINLDLPVLSINLAHLVAHEAYPGHHTEHSRKEVGLVRRRQRYEESIFLVGTPQCLIAEGLADLGLEIVMGKRPEELIAAHLRPLGIAYDAATIAVVAGAIEALGAVRANAAFRLHEDHADPEVVVEEVMRFGLVPKERAEKSVQFLLDPTWRSYISCYVEGLPLCRRFVGGESARFERLITEQLTPKDLQLAA
jgi:hypothetical protein